MALNFGLKEQESVAPFSRYLLQVKPFLESKYAVRFDLGNLDFEIAKKVGKSPPGGSGLGLDLISEGQ